MIFGSRGASSWGGMQLFGFSHGSCVAVVNGGPLLPDHAALQRLPAETARFRLDSSTVWLGATRWRGCTYTAGERASPGILAGSSPPASPASVIIACTQCHTRFKVPDGKVTARGRKVRCSRCGHTFRIYPGLGSRVGPTRRLPHRVRRAPTRSRPSGPRAPRTWRRRRRAGPRSPRSLARMEPAPRGEDFDVDVAGVESAGHRARLEFPPPPRARPRVGGGHGGPEAEPARGRERPGPGPTGGLTPPLRHPSETGAGRRPSPVRPADPAARTAAAEPAPSTPVRRHLLRTFPDRRGPHPDGPRPRAGRRPGSVPLRLRTSPRWPGSPRPGASPRRSVRCRWTGTLSSHVSSLAPVAEPESPPPAPQFGGAGHRAGRPPRARAGRASAGGRGWSWIRATTPATGPALRPPVTSGMQIELEPDLAVAGAGLAGRPRSPRARARRPDPAWAAPGRPAIAPVAPPAARLSAPGLGRPVLRAPPPPPAPAVPREPAIAAPLGAPAAELP